jgi:hypothetical protein
MQLTEHRRSHKLNGSPIPNLLFRAAKKPTRNFNHNGKRKAHFLPTVRRIFEEHTLTGIQINGIDGAPIFSAIVQNQRVALIQLNALPFQRIGYQTPVFDKTPNEFNTLTIIRKGKKNNRLAWSFQIL